MGEAATGFVNTPALTLRACCFTVRTATIVSGSRLIRKGGYCLTGSGGIFIMRDELGLVRMVKMHGQDARVTDARAGCPCYGVAVPAATKR